MTPSTLSPLGLYVHIPFCQRKCPYCDFNTYAGLRHLHRPLAHALALEIERTGERLGHPSVRTIFIGGGTPSFIPLDALAEVLAACRRAFRVAPDAEITSEANPGTVDRARFLGFRQLGINRLSLGAQSFDADELRFLGRIHGPEEIERAFDAARQAGFDNINLDLIFGLPHQRQETWLATLRRTVTLGPEHISCYSLTVEAGTPLAEWVAQGRVDAPDDDEAAEHYEMAQRVLAEAGYVHYEISNWARQSAHRDYRCRHNLIYWRNEPYLGFGPGAHSSLEGRRWWNLRSPTEYIRRIEAGEDGVENGETIDHALAMGETMMLGLRLVEEGVEEERFARQHGRALTSVYGAVIANLAAQGLLERSADRVRLTSRGRLLGNQVFQQFLP